MSCAGELSVGLLKLQKTMLRTLALGWRSSVLGALGGAVSSSLRHSCRCRVGARVVEAIGERVSKYGGVPGRGTGEK